MRRTTKHSGQITPANSSTVIDNLESRILFAGELLGAGAVSMAFDSAGALHVAYYDSAATDLKYTVRNPDGTWTQPTTVDAGPAVGSQLSLALNSSARPGIAYYDAANADLKYASLGDAGWTTAVVDSKFDVGQNPSLAYAGTTPVVTYYNATRQDLKLATTLRNGKWRGRTLDAKGTTGRFSSVAINPTNNTWAVAYESITPRARQIKVKATKGAGVVATLADASGFASKPSMAFDAGGAMGVTYGDPAGGALLLARRTDPGRGRMFWGAANVATGPGAGADNVLHFDPATGLARVSFTNAQGQLAVATQAAGGAFSSVAFGNGTTAVSDLDPLGQGVAVVSEGSIVFAPPSNGGNPDPDPDPGPGPGPEPVDPDAPAAPTGLTATVASGTQVNLSWTDNAGDETAYLVTRSSNGGGFATLATLGANANSYSDTTAVEGVLYQYRVRAVRDGLNSAAASVTALVPATNAPATPTQLVATSVSDTEVNLTWERVGAGEEFIQILRSTGGGPYVEVARRPAGSNIFTDTALYPSTAYAYQVLAGNNAGNSAPTSAVAATTQAPTGTLPTPGSISVTATSAFSTTVSWTDASSGNANWLLERSDNGGASYAVIAVVGNEPGTMTYVDAPLAPSTTHTYRTRLVGGSGHGNYSPAGSATTAARPAGAPLEAAGLSATVNSATGVTVTWADTNGGAATYVVERAPFSWTAARSWTEVGQTAAGATSFTISTSAETFYYVRVRARSASGVYSGYTPEVKFRTASPGTGTAKVYDIGPGRTYTSLGALDWSLLGPGDTVRIHANTDAQGNVIPYYEKPLISVRGTEAAPIRIVGVPHPVTGAKPIIDGTNATTSSQWQSYYTPLHDSSLVLVGSRDDNNNPGWSPGYFELSGFEIRNGYRGDPNAAVRTYRTYDGSTRNYEIAHGVYIAKGDHILLKGNTIHGNNSGVFGAGQGDSRNLEYLTLDSNDIYDNGTINSDRQHNTYLEGINTLYQFNRYGLLKDPVNGGGGLKDRGAGTVVRYNRFEDGGHLLDIVETQNYASVLMTMPSYHRTDVYGNVFYNNGATRPIHYGGDSSPYPMSRKGVLYFYNNTVVTQADQSQMWRVVAFQLESAGESLDARNNVISFVPSGSGPIPQIQLVTPEGVAYFGRNWITSGWVLSDPVNPFTGHVAGTSNLVSNAQNDPGFVSLASRDFRLAAGSPLIDQCLALQADALPVEFEYLDSITGELRTIVGGGMDLGAYERD